MKKALILSGIAALIAAVVAAAAVVFRKFRCKNDNEF